MSLDEQFRSEIERLREKYDCPDLEIIPFQLSKEQLEKTQFDEQDLHFEEYEIQNYQYDGKLYIPSFYEDKYHLPTGSKFIRSSVSYRKGDLVQIEAAIGHWKVKSFDVRHKEYVIKDRKNDIIKVNFGYWHEQNRWALLNKEKDWKRRKEELENDLNNPLLRQTDIDFYELLMEGNEAEKVYNKTHTKKTFYALIEKMDELDWYLVNVPELWTIIKSFPLDLYETLLPHIDHLHQELLPTAREICHQHESESLNVNDYPELQEFYSSITRFVTEGYEIVDENVYPNALLMLNQFQQGAEFNTLDRFEEYKKIALALHQEHPQKKSFISLKKVEKEYNKPKKPNAER